MDMNRRKYFGARAIAAALGAALLLSAFAGCGGEVPPPPDEGDDPAPDAVSQYYDIAFYSETELKNCAEGLVLVTKKADPDEAGTCLRLCWGTDDGALEGYSPLASFDNLSAGEYEFEFPDNALIPEGATKLRAELLDAEGNVLDAGSTGVEAYKQESELLYEFQVISDQQLSAFDAFYRRSEKTFADIRENSPDSVLIAVNGDIVDEANAAFYDRFYESYSAVYGDEGTQMLVGLGNHEFIVQSENDRYDGVSEAELARRYEQRLALWKQKTGNDSPYFAREIEGSWFIFLGTTAMPRELDGNTRADCTLGAEQLSWLERTMEEAGRSGKPIYLFSHGSLRDTVSGSLTDLSQTWYGYSEEEEQALRAILGKYPQTLVFSSHSHWSFESESPYLIGEDSFSCFNTAAIGYLWQGTGGGEHYGGGDYENGGAQGLYVRVYEDYVAVLGRQFEALDGESKYWYSGYQVILPTGAGD